MITATFPEDCFSDKGALVTGGTSGIAAAIGNALAELGASVTITGATAAEVEDAAKRASFHCAPAAAFVIGSIIAVDGGCMAG